MTTQTQKKYAVTKPTSLYNQDVRPFGECLLVVKETAQMVTVQGSRFGHGVDGITRINKRDVLFYSDVDISYEVRNANNQCAENYNSLVALVKHTRKSMAASFALPD